jgi:hypothetical protein
MNQRTSYLDLSVTYGSTQKKVDELIDMKTGIIIIIIIIIIYNYGLHEKLISIRTEGKKTF